MSDAIVVTGASTGIGRAIALFFAQKGWRVYAGVRKEADAQALEQAHANIEPVFMDVTSAEQIAQAARLIAEKEGANGLRALVNNAGITIPSPVEAIPLDELRKQFEINVFGAVAVTQAFMPHLRQYGRGAAIVNISSTSARMSSPLTGAYSASKMALEGLNDSLRIELRPWGIRVVSIQPGPVSTPIWDKTLAESDNILAKIDPKTVAAYRPIMDFVKARVIKDPHFPAERVAEVVWKAVTRPSSAVRYMVAGNPLGYFLTHTLPPKWRDALFALALPKWGDER